MIKTYEISVATGVVDGAGTDADVFITLYGIVNGNEVSSGERLLDSPTDDFERGNVNVFQIPIEDLGELIRITIRHDNSGHRPGWFLDRVTVRDPLTRTSYLFPCNQWLAGDEGTITRDIDVTKR